MSRPELLAALAEATPAAPGELRARIRLLAADAAPPARRRPSRRLALAAFAVAGLAAALAAAVLLPGSGRQGSDAASRATDLAGSGYARVTAPAHIGAVVPAAGVASSAAALPAPSPSRAQRYGATLHLRLRDGSAVAAAVRSAVEIAQRFGGYPQALSASVGAARGSARVVLRVPRGRVTAAIGRLSALGRVVGEQVSLSDLQAGVDTTGVRIVRLERELAAALHAPQTAQNQRLAAALSSEIEGLQRARASTLAAARDATVTLDLATPPAPKPVHPHAKVVHHGPFYALGRAFRVVGIAAVYVLALGSPLAALAFVGWLLASRLRRRGEERLLSRS